MLRKVFELVEYGETRVGLTLEHGPVGVFDYRNEGVGRSGLVARVMAALTSAKASVRCSIVGDCAVATPLYTAAANSHGLNVITYHPAC